MRQNRWLLITFLGFFLACQSDPQITIRVSPKVLPDSAQVYLTGNQPDLGSWQPDGKALQPGADGRWQTRLTYPPGTAVEFKITRGSWQTEAVSATGRVPGNHVLTVQNDTTLDIVVENWRDLIAPEAPEGITGTVRYHRNFPASGLAARDVRVWLPPGYETDPKARYPVLYMHDGQNVFDPNTSFLGAEWRADEVADSLIRAGKIREILIVAVANTPQRSREYSDGEMGQKYLNFLVNELKPFIDRNYRTRPERAHTAVMGSSMGGLISFLAGWYYPEVFSMAACLSPAFIWNDFHSVQLVRNYRGPQKNIRIYMDNGGLGREDTLQVGCDSMRTALKKIGFREGQNLRWYRDPHGQHNERAWARRLWRPLLFLFGKT